MYDTVHIFYHDFSINLEILVKTYQGGGIVRFIHFIHVARRIQTGAGTLGLDPLEDQSISGANLRYLDQHPRRAGRNDLPDTP